MDQARKNCLIPLNLVPICPICGVKMAMHLRCDNHFVEEEAWHDVADRYAGCLDALQGKMWYCSNWERGFIRRLSFNFLLEGWCGEFLLQACPFYIDKAVVTECFRKRAIGIGGDMAKAVSDINI